MLVLTRHENESIIINGNIEVVVLGIKGGQVRLGIAADKDIPVHRLEVHERIQREKGND